MRPLAPEDAWDYLLDILGRQAYTTEELRRKLLRRGIEPDDAEALLRRLEAYDLVNDAQYAQLYVSSRKAQRGKHALRQGLRRKGVEEALVEGELATLPPEQQADAATALLRRFAWRYRPRDEDDRPEVAGRSRRASRIGALGAGSDPTDAEAADAEAADAERARHDRARRERARAFAFLARRGFASDVAALALERVGWFEDLP